MVGGPRCLAGRREPAGRGPSGSASCPSRPRGPRGGGAGVSLQAPVARGVAAAGSGRGGRGRFPAGARGVPPAAFGRAPAAPSAAGLPSRRLRRGNAFEWGGRGQSVESNAAAAAAPAYGDRCARLLAVDGIRFAGIIDAGGSLVAGGFGEGIEPLEGDEDRLKSFMEFVSRVSIRSEYDSSLGPINYLAARRDRAVLVSFPFPLTRVLLLVSAEPSSNIEELARTVVDVFAGVS